MSKPHISLSHCKLNHLEKRSLGLVFFCFYKECSCMTHHETRVECLMFFLSCMLSV